jgi:capsular exopolysaccharide synthesis family protein
MTDLIEGNVRHAESGFDLAEPLRVVRRRWRLIAGVGGAVALLFILIGLAQPSTYTASGLVMVNPRPESVMADAEVLGPMPAAEAAIESEREVIVSRPVVGRLVDAQDLTSSPIWNRASNAADVRESTISAVQRSVSASRRGESYVLQVSAEAPNAEEAQRIANGLIDAYFETQSVARIDATERANVWLSQRLDSLREDLQNAEVAMENYRAENNLMQVHGASFTEQRALELQSAIQLARSKVAGAEARLRQIEDMRRRGLASDTNANVLSSGVISGLRAQQAAVARQEAELRTRYGANHPALARIAAERADLDSQVRAEIQRITANLRDEVEVARAELAVLTGDERGLGAQLASDNQSLLKLREFERSVEARRTVYEELLARFNEIAGLESLKVADVRLVQAAVAPGAPSSPNVGFTLALGLAVGAVAGLLAGLVRELLDDTVTSARDVEREVGTPALMTIPELDRDALRAVAHEGNGPAAYLVRKPLSSFSESVDALRFAIIRRNGGGRGAQVVAVTSVFPGDGKTTVSLALARSAAPTMKTIIVDCDLRRRTLSLTHTRNVSQGLGEVLAGSGRLEASLKPDTLSHATILPASGRDCNPRVLFSSDAFPQLLERLRAQYDLVVLDCPPALVVADTRLIAEHADGVLLVARWSRTPVRAVSAALSRLKESNARIFGVVMNRVDPRDQTRLGYDDPAYYHRVAAGYYRA